MFSLFALTSGRRPDRSIGPGAVASVLPIRAGHLALTVYKLVIFFYVKHIRVFKTLLCFNDHVDVCLRLMQCVK